jgi:hypothetical protein
MVAARERGVETGVGGRVVREQRKTPAGRGIGYWAAGVTGLTTPAMKRWAREVALSMERQRQERTVWWVVRMTTNRRTPLAELRGAK